MKEKFTHTHMFTDEYVEYLSNHPCVKRVSNTSVSFTDEFRAHFYEERRKGKTSTAIFESIGIDVKILGEKRVEGFCRATNKEFKYCPPKKAAKDYVRQEAESNDIKGRLRALEHELAYTRQEVEFLKKIHFANMEAQKKW